MKKSIIFLIVMMIGVFLLGNTGCTTGKAIHLADLDEEQRMQLEEKQNFCSTVFQELDFVLTVEDFGRAQELVHEALERGCQEAQVVNQDTSKFTNEERVGLSDEPTLYKENDLIIEKAVPINEELPPTDWDGPIVQVSKNIKAKYQIDLEVREIVTPRLLKNQPLKQEYIGLVVCNNGYADFSSSFDYQIELKGKMPIVVKPAQGVKGLIPAGGCTLFDNILKAGPKDTIEIKRSTDFYEIKAEVQYFGDGVLSNNKKTQKVWIRDEDHKNFELSDFPQMYNTSGYFNGTFVVGQNAHSSDIYSVTEISGNFGLKVSSNPIRSRLDIEIKDSYDKVISVGKGSQLGKTIFHNHVSADLLTAKKRSSTPVGQTYPGIKKGLGRISIFSYNNNPQIVVDGYSQKDVGNAAKVLGNWKKYKGKLVGYEVCIKDNAGILQIVDCI